MASCEGGSVRGQLWGHAMPWVALNAAETRPLVECGAQKKMELEGAQFNKKGGGMGLKI